MGTELLSAIAAGKSRKSCLTVTFLVSPSPHKSLAEPIGCTPDETSRIAIHHPSAFQPRLSNDQFVWASTSKCHLDLVRRQA